MTPPPLGVLIEIMAKKHPHPLIENEYPPKSRRRRCSKEALCAAGQKGAPILFRACARRAAGDGVCRGSAVAAGRPPGEPPEAMVSPEHHHSGIDVKNKLYTCYRRTRNAILCLNKL